MRDVQDRLARRMLALGAGAGIAAGILAAGIGGRDGGAPVGAVALVDERPILREDFERALEGFANDRREAPTEQDRARILARLVDEELLARHALARNLLVRERAVRDVALRSMVDAIGAEASGHPPSEEELRALWATARETDRDDAPAAATFEEARGALEDAYAERARDEAVRVYLEGLRARARIEMPDETAR